MIASTTCLGVASSWFDSSIIMLWAFLLRVRLRSFSIADLAFLFSREILAFFNSLIISYALSPANFFLVFLLVSTSVGSLEERNGLPALELALLFRDFVLCLSQWLYCCISKEALISAVLSFLLTGSNIPTSTSISSSLNLSRIASISSKGSLLSQFKWWSAIRLET